MWHVGLEKDIFHSGHCGYCSCCDNRTWCHLCPIKTDQSQERWGFLSSSKTEELPSIKLVLTCDYDNQHYGMANMKLTLWYGLWSPQDVCTDHPPIATVSKMSSVSKPDKPVPGLEKEFVIFNIAKALSNDHENQKHHHHENDHNDHLHVQS